MYTSIFDCLRAIARYWSEIATFSYPLHLTLPYSVAPGTIAVNVTRLERGFNVCKTPRFPVIQAWILKVRHFSTFFAHFGLPCVRPWDNRGKCYTARKRIQCLSKASQHVPIYLQPFLRYSKLLVENFEIFTLHLYLAAPQGWPSRNFAKILIYTKLEWIGYCAMKKAWQYVQPFWYSTSVWLTDVQPISITFFNIADARKNRDSKNIKDSFYCEQSLKFEFFYRS